MGRVGAEVDRVAGDDFRADLGRHGARVVFAAIEKRFGAVAAVDGVSLDVAPGEFVTLLGPSGSGKTTTLMMLAGFEIPSAGEIYVDDRPIAAVPPYRRNIGMVFQSYALFPHMTVGENIAFPLKLRKIGRDQVRQRTQDVLELIGLPGYEGRFPRQLSGGQQQRIALARALVFNPRVLLMDEPLGALDKQLREHLQLEIKALHGQLGVTIVYVTHDQQEALVMSDRVAVMNRGRIEQIATPEEVYDDPANRFVAAFIGESNFLEGNVIGLDNGYARLELPGTGEILVPAPSEGHVATSSAATIRPEKLIVETAEAPNGGAGGNSLTATVEDVIFVGESRRYQLRLAGGQGLVVKEPNRAGAITHARGASVRVGWAVGDGRLVSSESSHHGDHSDQGDRSERSIASHGQ